MLREWFIQCKFDPRDPAYRIDDGTWGEYQGCANRYQGMIDLKYLQEEVKSSANPHTKYKLSSRPKQAAKNGEIADEKH